MGIHTSKFSLHKEALLETLEAIKILTKYNKQDKNEWGQSDGCLGYPSAVLIFSFINSIGALFEGEIINGREINNDKSTFQILNSTYFNNQNLEVTLLDELYEVYRNKLTHNFSLPINYYMSIKSEKGNWFELTKNNSGKEVITTIYLVDLLNLCKGAFERIKNEHEAQYENSKNIKNIDFKNIANNLTPLYCNSSGVTHYENK